MNLRLAAAALAVFLLGVLVYHEKADFAFFYHVDEPTKVDQLIQNSRNYFHPLLLLNTAGLIYDFAGQPHDSQRTVEAGRLASAMFSAAVLALAMIVCVQNAGWLAGWLVVAALLLDSSLYEFAHYFKEDPAMNFGLALFCLAATQYQRRSVPWTAALLGIAVGVAASGKYIGLFTLPFAFFMLLAARGPETNRLPLGRLMLWFGAGFFASVCLINWQVLFEGRAWIAGFHSEIGRVDDRLGNEGSFQLKAWQRIAYAFSPVTALLLLAYLLSPIFRRRRLTPAQWTFLGLLVAFGLLLLSASRTGGRYNSPIILLSLICAAIAAAWITTALAARFSRRATLVMAVCALGFTGVFVLPAAPDFLACRRNFHFDSRLELMKFIEKSLPPTAFLAEEYDVRLPDPSRADHFVAGLNLPQRRYVVSYEKKWLPDVMNLDELRHRGITHVVLLWSSDKKKIAQTTPAEAARLKEPDRKRALFYHELTTAGALLWECRGGSPDHVCPSLRLYAVPPAG